MIVQEPASPDRLVESVALRGRRRRWVVAYSIRTIASILGIGCTLAIFLLSLPDIRESSSLQILGSVVMIAVFLQLALAVQFAFAAWYALRNADRLPDWTPPRFRLMRGGVQRDWGPGWVFRDVIRKRRGMPPAEPWPAPKKKVTEDEPK